MKYSRSDALLIAIALEAIGATDLAEQIRSAARKFRHVVITVT